MTNDEKLPWPEMMEVWKSDSLRSDAAMYGGYVLRRDQVWNIYDGAKMIIEWKRKTTMHAKPGAFDKLNEAITLLKKGIG